MKFGEFTPQKFMTGDKYKPKEHLDRPLIVIPRERRENLTTEFKPNGDGVGVSLDIVDLIEDRVYVSVLWMSGAQVDGLSPYCGTGQALPIKIVNRQPKSSNGRAYNGLEPLTGDELALATAWDQANPDRVDRERKAREDEVKAQSPNVAAAKGATGLNPMPAQSAPATAPEPEPEVPIAPASPEPDATADQVKAALAKIGATK